MRIDILTVLPELLESPLSYSIIKRSADKGLVNIFIHNIVIYITKNKLPLFKHFVK